MMGGIMDGIGQVLTYGLHLKDGAFLEASWDNAFYSRHWNAPPRVDVIVMPPTGDPPGRRRRVRRGRVDGRHRVRPRARHGQDARGVPDQPGQLGFEPYPPSPRYPRRRPTGCATATRPSSARRRSLVPTHTFMLNGERVSVDCPDNVRAAVGPSRPARRHRPQVRLRHQRLQGVHLPHQRQGLQPLLGPGLEDHRSDEITTIEGLADTVGRRPAPDAGGLAGRGRRPVRLLPARPDHDRGLEVNEVRRKEGRKPSPTATSTRSATSAAAAPTRGSARRSRRARRGCPELVRGAPRRIRRTRDVAKAS